METKIEVIEEKYSKEEAIKKKLKKLIPKLFGIPISKYTITDINKVFVPYYLVNYSYKMTLNSGVNTRKSIHERKTGVVVDSIEGRSYVIDADEKIPLIKIYSEKLDGKLIKGNFTKEQSLQKSFEYLRWRVIAKIYREIPEITQTSSQLFYRPMWELKLLIWGKEVTKMAPTDDFETSKQSLKGLKR